MSQMDSRVVLYDGKCNLCNSSVAFILKRDTKKLFTYIPLQSEEGELLLKRYNLQRENYDTLYLIAENMVYERSTAVLMICKDLRGFAKYLHYFIYIPKIIRDGVYNFISKNRYILSNSKSCER